MKRDDLMRIAVARLANDEGFRGHAYLDTQDTWTIGYGSTRHADGTPVKEGDTISERDAREELERDVREAAEGLDHAVSWWRGLPDDAQIGLLFAAFQLGVSGVMGFRNMLRALRRGDYETAAVECVQGRSRGTVSAWFEQTPDRPLRVAARFLAADWEKV